MNDRELYLIDQTGKVIRRWSVIGWPEDWIRQLEAKIRAISDASMSLRDSAFDRAV